MQGHKGVKMTKKQEIYRKQLLYRIHTNSLYIQIKNNDAWQDWLDLRFKAKSCAELSIGELRLTLDILLGNARDDINFKPDYAGRNLIRNKKIDKSKNHKDSQETKTKRGKKQTRTISEKYITPNQFNYIKELAVALDMNETDLIKFAIKQTRSIYIRLEQLEKISMDNATNIITGLEKIIKFKRKKRQNDLSKLRE